MSEGVGRAGPRAAATATRGLMLARNVPQRLRERAFWIIQVGVVTVAGLHLLAELWVLELDVVLQPALHHVPVILYLAPITYASLRYGIEGAFLTGVWCAVLTLPNILILHPGDLEWVTEVGYVGIVIAVGVTMAVPVERERRQRHRAEATSRRLALLNEIATRTLTGDLDRTLRGALASLVAVLDLEAACVAVEARPGTSGLEAIARHPPDPAGLDACLARLDLPQVTGRVHTIDERRLAVPFDADLPDPTPRGRVRGLLLVETDPTHRLDGDDHRLLVGVANQLATALANERLKDLERDRVRSYARLLTAAQEEERKRLARELHDEAAQNLVAIRRGLTAFAPHVERLGDTAGDVDGRRELDGLRELTADTLAGLRRFSRALRPTVLDDLGLRSALEALAAEVDQRGDLHVELSVDGVTRRLDPDIELMLFRIGQAALHNVDQHADADHADVRLTFGEDAVRLCVADDGRGFDVPSDAAELAARGKLGLLGIQERATLAGAMLTIQSRPGRGTRVEVTIAHRTGATAREAIPMVHAPSTSTGDRSHTGSRESVEDDRRRRGETHDPGGGQQ
jgi:signal transduction histidine kinase